MARKRVQDAIVLHSWEEADDALRQIGENRRDIAAAENVMNEQISAAKADAEARARPLKEQIAMLEMALRTFTQEHRSDLGKAKSRQMTFGWVGFRKSTRAVLPRGAERIRAVVEALKLRGMTECIVYQEPKVDKDALKKYSAEEIASVGAKLETEDVFGYAIDEDALAK